MCGRFALTYTWEEMVEWFKLIPSTAMSTKQQMAMPARYNIAPTQPIVMVKQAEGGGREGMLVRWGLVPSWVKDPKAFTLLINARSETAAKKPSFRNAMRHRRTLVPASGFYEWKRYPKESGLRSQAYWVRPKTGGIVTFGGLMETWSGADGSEIDTGCILTTDTNPAFSAIHNRLPMVIQPEDFDRWLDCKTQEPRDVADLMRPANDDFFEAVPIGNAVNKVANSGPDIQKPVEAQPDQQPSVQDEEQDKGPQMSLF